MVEGICREIELQQNYLRTSAAGNGQAGRITLETVYFGGGTPSMLTAAELQQIFDTIQQYFLLLPGAEVTLEANPDDLSWENLAHLREFPINRLSIGIQSFHEAHLRYLNRAHSAHQAETCVQLAQKAGFSNLSVDLIYAIPATGHAIWQADLEKVISLDVPHISAYCLTIEPRTVFGKWVAKGRIKAVEEEFAAQQFEMLVEFLDRHGYEPYEISNFARPGCYSGHNRSYWQPQPYLGVGPSAHSYNGITRQYNVADNAHYLKALAENRIPCTVEELSVNDRINEYLMTSLRTQWGCDTQYIRQQYGVDMLLLHRDYLSDCQAKGLLVRQQAHLRLTLKGKLLADKIASDLFLV